MQRRKLRAKQLNKKNEMTVQYQAGRFDFSSETEDITSFKKKKKTRINKSNQKEFIIELN